MCFIADDDFGSAPPAMCSDVDDAPTSAAPAAHSFADGKFPRVRLDVLLDVDDLTSVVPATRSVAAADKHFDRGASAMRSDVDDDLINGEVTTALATRSGAEHDFARVASALRRDVDIGPVNATFAKCSVAHHDFARVVSASHAPWCRCRSY